MDAFKLLESIKTVSDHLVKSGEDYLFGAFLTSRRYSMDELDAKIVTAFNAKRADDLKYYATAAFFAKLESLRIF